ncbi:MAG: endonuclease III [Candidatus Diapherotrites archaeon]
MKGDSEAAYFEKILRALREEAGGEAAVVQHRAPFMVLVSTVLSARTRDENTARASARLFAKFRTPREIANAGTAELRRLIKPCGFYRTKARNIKKLSREILGRFGGKVPGRLEELITLPGVGRKTANCVLVYAFGKPAIPVDVHVHRVSNRIGLVKTRKPEETERALMAAVPRKYWIEINNLMVKFGRKRCGPVRPRCEGCKIAEMCEYNKLSEAAG